MFYKKYRALKVNELVTVNSTRLLLHVNSCQTYRMTPFKSLRSHIFMFYKQYRTLKVNELLNLLSHFQAVMTSFHLWCAALFEPESAKSYLSNVEFLPFLHKFNTFTFYTPYLLFLDQQVNAYFPSGFKTNIFGEYIANTPYLFVFLPKGKRQCIRRVTPIFSFDQLVNDACVLIYVHKFIYIEKYSPKT